MAGSAMTGSGGAVAGGSTVAVTGATGFVGRHLVRALLDRGMRVRALTRDAAKAARVLPDSDAVTPVVGDVLDERVLRTLVEGADACCHLVGIIREAAGGQTFRRCHVLATRAVVAACRAGGVRRYAHMSALGASPEGPSRYQTTKFEAERAVVAGAPAWTIIRPGLILGPDGDFWQQLKGWCEGRRLPLVFLPYFLRVEAEWSALPPKPPRLVPPEVAPAWVGDVANAFADALERPETVHEVYELCGADPVRWPDLLRRTRDRLPQAKKELRPVGLPGPIAELQARAWKLIGMERAMPFDVGMAQMGSRDSVCGLSKAEAHLGFRPRGLDDTLAACVG